MNHGENLQLNTLIIGGIILLLLYFIPTFIAFIRRHPNRWVILVLNAVFGATAIGWLGAFVWAVHAIHRSNTPGGSDGGESGVNLFVNDVAKVQVVGGAPGSGNQNVPSEDDDIRKLERLVALRRDGHIDDAEFNALKGQIVRRS